MTYVAQFLHRYPEPRVGSVILSNWVLQGPYSRDFKYKRPHFVTSV
jgi:hypothetical protein